ncbi:UDP-N-acetylglucosamine 2-epimerase [Litorivicinus sp.]|nr:UDP-N-acetylglucosamine 2-epimerase [Litorivicinus sp.]
MKVGIFSGSRADFWLQRSVYQSCLKQFDLDPVYILGNELGCGANEAIFQTLNFDKAKYKIIKNKDASTGKLAPFLVSESMLRELNNIEGLGDLDCLVVLGDRYETLLIVFWFVLHRIPVFHIHGGEKTLGSLDDRFRHAITKLADVHFTSESAYANRILQLGEDPKNVHVVGSIGQDLALQQASFDLCHLEQILGVKLEGGFAMVTFHPETTAVDQGSCHLRPVMNWMMTHSSLLLLVSKPNNDPGSEEIESYFKSLAVSYPERILLLESLSQETYFSLLKESQYIVGNSSSNIIEAPVFQRPILNIGRRQEGRICSQFVVNYCFNSNDDDVSSTFERLDEIGRIFKFQDDSIRLKNKNRPSELIAKKISGYLASEDLNKIEKVFFDIEVASIDC